MRFAEAGFSLEINLSRGSIDKIATDPGTTGQYLGGQGSAAKLIWDRIAPETDPFSPDNLLIFSAGLLAGTPVPGANRTSVSSISPQTDRYVHSGLGGFFGPELKHAGYDAIVIRGKSPNPVYLRIHNDQVELRDAAHLKGKNALETTSLIQQELNCADVQVAAIGLAGENRVFQACIDHANCSASQGVGVIMGDKGLKAIAVRGTRDITVARPEACFESCLDQHRDIHGNARCGELFLDAEDDSWHAAHLPWPAAAERVKGYRTSELQDDWAVAVETEQISYQWENYSQELEEVRETVVDKSELLRGTGCYNCPKECHQAASLPGRRIYFLKNYARLAYAVAAYPELQLNYEILAALQEYGLDESAMAQLYAFTGELYGAGILTAEDLPGYPDDAAGRFGYLIEKVARREGLGDALANGIYRAARQIGRGAEAHERCIRRVEQLPLATQVANLPHIVMAATGDKMNVTQIEGSFPQLPIPDRQQRAAFVADWDAAPERFKEWFLAWEPGQELPVAAAVDIADWNEGMHYLDDALGVCPLLSSFRGQYGGQPPYHLHNLPQFISQATGADLDTEQLWEVSKRIRQLIRGINARRGASREDNGEQEPVASCNDPALEQHLLHHYHQFRGWTPDGVPTRSALEQLGLHFVSDELVRSGTIPGHS